MRIVENGSSLKQGVSFMAFRGRSGVNAALPPVLNRVLVVFIAVALLAGCKSAKPPPPTPLHVEEAQRAAAQAAKSSEEANWAAAANQWKVAADLYFLLNDRTNAAIALHNLGQARRGGNDFSRAEEALVEAAKINEELGRQKEWFRNYLALAQVAANAGNTNAVAERLEALSRVVDKVEDAELKGTFHNEVGLWRLEQGRFSEAAEAVGRAGKYFREAKDRYGIATVMANEAKIYERQGNYPAAMDSWQVALGEFEKLANPTGIAHSLLGLGRTLLLANQDLPKAEDLLRRAARNFGTLNKPKELQEAQALLAKCLKAQGKTE
jgi:tetratricopeptide (TPR) repeat protein